MTHIAYGGAARRRHGRTGHSPLLSPMVVLALATLGAAAFVAYILWPRWPGEAVSLDAPALPVVIAGAHFNVEPAAVRRPVQRRPGIYDRIDLAYLWPSLLPPDPTLKPTPDNPIDPNERVFVTITNGELSLPLPERVRTIYPRYLAAETRELPEGWRAQPFRDGTPYAGEDLVSDGDDFLARCSRKEIGNSGICLYEHRIGDADVTVRFPRDWLADAAGLKAGLNRLFGKIVPNSGG